MKHINKQQIHEIFIYSVLWIIVFLIPIFEIYFKSISTNTLSFSWKEIFSEWMNILPYLLLFIIHNWLLTNLFLVKHKPGLYLMTIFATLILFHLYIRETIIPEDDFPIVKNRNERMGPHELFPDMAPPAHSAKISNPNSKLQTGPDDFDKPKFRPAKKPLPDKGKFIDRPFLFPGPDFMCTLILLMMFGINLAIKLFFKSQQDEEAVKELEKHSLQQELEYLKYQINPHFFMNTLNNIHALVDINSEKAKETIIELSKLMRYVLYESSNKTVPLSREIEFLNHYIDLMKLRYNDDVKIHSNLSEPEDNIMVPPLLFISFVENAFKHGISYHQNSFISISIKTDNKHICFHCTNSKHKTSPQKGDTGMGLENVKKRLRLLYRDKFELKIADSDIFDVQLMIPII